MEESNQFFNFLDNHFHSQIIRLEENSEKELNQLEGLKKSIESITGNLNVIIQAVYEFRFIKRLL